MVALAAILGTVIVVGVLVEAFETIVLPRRAALAEYLLVPLPPWFRSSQARDNWRTSRWGGAFTV
jgi:hypothetical protein